MVKRIAILTVLMLAAVRVAAEVTWTKDVSFRTEEQGTSSWYGKERQGKYTSSGERFDMLKMTAAHRELPLGTLVRVTRKDTGAWVIVRINDRGPGIADRLIDLSWQAAKQLGFTGAGLIEVSVEVTKLAPVTADYYRLIFATKKPTR